MTMACCPKLYAVECEILVFVDAPAPHNLSFYNCLRFDLLASSWLPSPLGIFLWSALHAMLLVVGGPVLWVLSWLTAFFLFSVLYPVYMGIFIGSPCVVFVLIAAAFDLACLLAQSIRFCWSLVRFLECHEPIVEWRSGFCWTVKFWKDFKDSMKYMLGENVQFGVPCMSGSWYEATKVRQLKTWARWFQEVMHMHEAIIL